MLDFLLLVQRTLPNSPWLHRSDGSGGQVAVALFAFCLCVGLDCSIVGCVLFGSILFVLWRSGCEVRNSICFMFACCVFPRFHLFVCSLEIWMRSSEFHFRFGLIVVLFSFSCFFYHVHVWVT